MDIGTTTICGTVVDVESGGVIASATLANDSFLPSTKEFERLQNTAVILERVREIMGALLTPENDVRAIGVTGQMHGIVYFDAEGAAESPLYTWQDGRGNTPFGDEKNYAGYLSEASGHSLATGFGAVTHFYNLRNGLIPETTRGFCTIPDYIAMKIARLRAPRTHVSNAASLGMFDLGSMRFDRTAIAKCGMDADMFPPVTGKCEVVGNTPQGVPVIIAIGDNQASFAGSVADVASSVLVNVGTGSQISLQTSEYVKTSAAESRPGLDGDYLLVGSSLCGGRAYSLLEGFFRETIRSATGIDPNSMYAWMSECAGQFGTLHNKLDIATCFCGTRSDPDKRGVISNLGTDNFTPRHLVVGVLEGIVNELYNVYENLRGVRRPKPSILIGSGNGMRKNTAMQRMFAQKFNLPLRIPVHTEEAAYGAALYAMVGGGMYKDIAEAQKIIKYGTVES